MGFNGIAAAFLGGLNPIGTILASFFIQHITAGGAYVDKTMYCAQISDLISSIIIYLCGFVLFMKHAMNSSIANREEKAASEGQGGGTSVTANGERRRSVMSSAAAIYPDLRLRADPGGSGRLLLRSTPASSTWVWRAS